MLSHVATRGFVQMESINWLEMSPGQMGSDCSQRDIYFKAKTF